MGRMPTTIAVDLDEVLGSFVEQLCAFHNERYGSCLSVSDFRSYQFWQVWGGTREEAQRKVYAFFDSHHFRQIPPIPNAKSALERLKQLGHRLFVVTSRQLVIEEETKRWLDAHYPGLFDGVRFGNHYANQGNPISKPELCRQIGASVIIDDCLEYAQQCAEAEMTVFLFDWDGRYPWNKVSPESGLHHRIQRITSWDDIVNSIP